MKTPLYMIYGREKDKKRFRPVDLENGQLVANVLYGTLFYKKGEAERVVQSLNEDNKDYEFTYKVKY